MIPISRFKRRDGQSCAMEGFHFYIELKKKVSPHFKRVLALTSAAGVLTVFSGHIYLTTLINLLICPNILLSKQSARSQVENSVQFSHSSPVNYTCRTKSVIQWKRNSSLNPKFYKLPNIYSSSVSTSKVFLGQRPRTRSYMPCLSG